jgi:hypothetical protein
VLGVGFDGSPESALALCSAAALARDLEARLRVVATGVSGFDACVAAERLAAGVPADVVTPGGDPVRALLGQAADGVDALVVGHRARPAAQRASLSARLMGSAGCPLWVVPTDASGVVLRRRAAVA